MRQEILACNEEGRHKALFFFFVRRPGRWEKYVLRIAVFLFFLVDIAILRFFFRRAENRKLQLLLKEEEE